MFSQCSSFSLLSFFFAVNFTLFTFISLTQNYAKAHTHGSFPHSISARGAFSTLTLPFPRALYLTQLKAVLFFELSCPSELMEECKKPHADRGNRPLQGGIG